MKIEAVLFDLDATLLPMDQDKFIEIYFKTLATKMTVHGYDPKEFAKNLWTAVMAMVKNTGEVNNEEVFWKIFTGFYAEKATADKCYHQDYYENCFDECKKACGYTEESNRLIKKLKSKGIKVVLATNPVFPSIATEKRMLWAGLDKNDFALYTTYENSRYCKPNPKYYIEILEKLGLRPENCLMVGNDTTDDMSASVVGIKTFLLTDCLINSKGVDITQFNNGSFKELNEYIDSQI